MVFAAVAQSGFALQYAAAEFRADKEVVLAAVRKNGYPLEYAAPGLQADKEVVIAAVAQDGGSLRYASAKLRADDETVRAAAVKGLRGWVETVIHEVGSHLQCKECALRSCKSNNNTAT